MCSRVRIGFERGQDCQGIIGVKKQRQGCEGEVVCEVSLYKLVTRSDQEKAKGLVKNKVGIQQRWKSSCSPKEVVTEEWEPGVSHSVGS